MRTPDFSDAQLLEALAEAAAELTKPGEPLTNGAYDAWQRGRDTAGSPALLIRRFGSWREACQAAGLEVNATRSTSRRWSEADIDRIVASYLNAPGSPGSYAGYTEWAKEQEDAPSGATLRQRGAWAEIKARAEALGAR
ncbi:homing endonuclease associated repeat-containing protein [Nocardioides montaniterrae]